MPSKKTKSDHFLAVVKAGISAVPFVGGSIASLIGDYVPSATQRSIEIAIEILKQKVEQLSDRIDPDAVNKEEFAELFKSCYLSIVRTQQRVKLNAAASLIANILLKESDPEKSTYTELDHFSRCLETLSIGAIETLGHAVKIARKSKPNEYRVQPVRFNFEDLKGCMPRIDSFLLMGLVGELSSMNLVHLAGAPQIATPAYANYPVQLTPLGVRFCERILEL
ncbi:hypothetical protein KA005_69440 [bacterium]|nr:hypothetical protein [bacterium]